MNSSQELWWRQARSDLSVLLLLRRHEAAPCHQLHYLQMVTEKIAKAYLWRYGHSPRRSHSGFVQFLRFLGGARKPQRRRIARALAYARFKDFQNWARSVLPLAYELERLAPSLAGDGPNPEYPWPQDNPIHAPVEFDFDLWHHFTNTGHGRQLIEVIESAVTQFPRYQ